MNEYFEQAKIDMNHSLKSDWWKLLNQKVLKNKAVIQVAQFKLLIFWDLLG